MDPFFTEEQLSKMSREDIISLTETMRGHYQKQETKIQILKKKTKELELLNVMPSDYLTLAQRKQFDPSSEKYTGDYTQLNLFNKAKQEADPDAPELGMEEIHPPSYKRKKHSDKKEEGLSTFEATEIIEYKLTGVDRNCPDRNIKHKTMTKGTAKCLKFVPARFEVAEEVIHVYSCPECGAVRRPERAPFLLKDNVITPSLMAGIMNTKYADGMPLARQKREFVRYDLSFSTKTMVNWTIQCANRCLRPLHELMREEFLRSRYTRRDETRVQVIDEPGQKGSIQNWMWVYLIDGHSDSPRVVLFQYKRTRAGYHPVEFPGDRFQEYFTYDGYQAYHNLPERIAAIGCMTHMRRRSDESMAILREDLTKRQPKKTTTYQAMVRIRMPYKIEEMIRDKSPEEGCGEHQKQAKPLLGAFFEWFRTLGEAVDRSSKIEEAILYTLNQETYLRRYLKDGHPSVGNLAAERALKNFTIGRRNWLFAENIRKAQASATVYNITKTTLLNGLKPYNYLTYVIEKVKDLGVFPAKEEMLGFLPWLSSLPNDCHSRLKK